MKILLHILSFLLCLPSLLPGQHWVQSITPAQNAIALQDNTSFIIEFSEVIDNSSLSATSIKIIGEHNGYYNFVKAFQSPSSLTLTPTENFRPGEQITLILTRSIQNNSGTSMPSAFIATYQIASWGLFGDFSAIELATATEPYALAAADFDSDGDVDLVTANRGSHNISFLRNDGNTTFSPTLYPVGLNPEDIATGDFDADGHIDLAVACAGGDEIYLLENTGLSGLRFQTSQMLDIGEPPHGIASNDLDGDGDLDLLVSTFSSGKVISLMNNGSGAFSNSATNFTGSLLEKAILKDVNNDGDLDAAICSFGFGKLFILENNGSGELDELNDITLGSQPHIPASADLNADGFEDIIVPNSSPNNLHILLNNGTASFNLAPIFSVSATPWAVTTFDMEADGDMDVAVTARGSEQVVVLANDGQGNLAFHQGLPTGSLPGMLIAADFDGNETEDLAVCNEQSNTVSIFFNEILGAAEEADPLAVTLRLGPNPARNTLLVELEVRQSCHHHSVAVCSLDGRIVRLLSEGQLKAGRHQWQWSGQADSGAALSAGMYYLQLKTAQSVKSFPIVWMPFR